MYPVISTVLICILFCTAIPILCPTILLFLYTCHISDGLFKAIEGSGNLIQQKVTQYFKKLMEVPSQETEV